MVEKIQLWVLLWIPCLFPNFQCLFLSKFEKALIVQNSTLIGSVAPTQGRLLFVHVWKISFYWWSWWLWNHISNTNNLFWESICVPRNKFIHLWHSHCVSEKICFLWCFCSSFLFVFPWFLVFKNLHFALSPSCCPWHLTCNWFFRLIDKLLQFQIANGHHSPGFKGRSGGSFKSNAY